MKTFTTMQAARELRKLYDAKALLAKIDNEYLHPVAPDDLAGREQLCQEEVHAMDLAEQGLKFLEDTINMMVGSEVWSQAMDIAYAPNNLSGYARVAEYYRRAEAIKMLSYYRTF